MHFFCFSPCGRRRRAARALYSALFVLPLLAGCGREAAEKSASEGYAADSATDALGRSLELAEPAARALCSGAGCLRLLTYLQAQDRIVAVDSIERRGSPLDARPYAIANPQFRQYPLFGEFRGWDNPELIAALDPQPQVIFKMSGGRGMMPAQLQEKTRIPVLPLHYGDLGSARSDLNRSLMAMGKIVGQTQRAREVIDYFDELEQDLRRRTRDIPEGERRVCYVGGIGHRGPHGLQSTSPAFEPFDFVSARNAAAPANGGTPQSYAVVSKEKIMMWDPEIIFIDISTLRLDANADALSQLRTDPAFRNLSAVRAGRIYGLFPHKSYHCNYESVFANAYYVGSVLYPERFADVDPLAKAEEIAAFLNGGPAFQKLNNELKGLAFRRIPSE